MPVAKFLYMEDKYYLFCSCSGSEKQVKLVGSFLTTQMTKNNIKESRILPEDR